MRYSLEEREIIFKRIIDNISLNGFSLLKCLREKDMPTRETFYKWLKEDKTGVLSDNYARATEDRADHIFEEIIVIADDQEGDTYEDKDGNEKENKNVINRARLRVDARKWVLSRMKPKKYGDRLTNIHEGGDNPVKINAIFNTDLLNVPTDDGVK